MTIKRNFQIDKELTKDLNKDQEEAINLIFNWLDGYSLITEKEKKQYFILTGPAGTGKSYLIKKVYDLFTAKYNPESVVIAAFTGKATTVLNKKGLPAETIHHLIYLTTSKEVIKEKNKENEEIKQQKEKEYELISRAKHYINSKIKLIIIDEFSMVSDYMFEDLLSYGVPILCVGDHIQLPAIQQGVKVRELMNHSDFQLNEIVRQQKDSGIIKFATDLRNGVFLDNINSNKDVKVLDWQKLSKNEIKNLLMEADQVICGTNKLRKLLNQEIRKIVLKDEIVNNPYPIVGDKVICLHNNWGLFLDKEQNYPLCNGIIGTVVETDYKNSKKGVGLMKIVPDFLEESSDWLPFDLNTFIEEDFNFSRVDEKRKLAIDMNNKVNFLERPNKNEPNYKLKSLEYLKYKKSAVMTSRMNYFDFAYAISCHKSQGSSNKKILIFDESKRFGNSKQNWLYTAVTRAEEEVKIIINL